MGKLGKHVTIMNKICIIFIALILIIFVMAYSLYNWGIEKIKVQMVDNLCMQNDQFSNVFNREIEQITLLQYALADNWDLLKLILSIDYFTEYEKALMMLKVKEKIIPIKNSSKIIEDIKIIIPSTGKYIGTKGIGLIKGETKELVEHYKDITPKQIIFFQDQWMIIAEYPVLYYKTDQPLQYLIQTILSEKNIGEYLENFDSEEGVEGFLWSPSCDDILAATSHEGGIRNIVDKMEKEEIKNIYSIDERQRDTYIQRVNIEGINYIVVSTKTDIQDIQIVKYISESKIFNELLSYKWIVYGFIIGGIVTIILFAYSIHLLIHTPLQKLMQGFSEVQKGNLKMSIEHQGEDEFKYIYQGFNGMTEQLDELINQYYAQKLLLQEAELKQLQAQINPHFLYNSFIILSNRIRAQDQEFAAEFCMELGNFFRYITRNNQSSIPLKEEVAHAYTYCNIQYARFNNRLTMELAPLPTEYESIEVPRLILQPIIENAFLYALEVVEDSGLLHIHYTYDSDAFYIHIEDNGDELTEEKLERLKNSLEETYQGETTGIINIHKRLQLTFAQQSGLTFSRSEYGGLKVLIRLPICKG